MHMKMTEQQSRNTFETKSQYYEERKRMVSRLYRVVLSVKTARTSLRDRGASECDESCFGIMMNGHQNNCEAWCQIMLNKTEATRQWRKEPFACHLTHSPFTLQCCRALDQVSALVPTEIWWARNMHIDKNWYYNQRCNNYWYERTHIKHNHWKLSTLSHHLNMPKTELCL